MGQRLNRKFAIRTIARQHEHMVDESKAEPSRGIEEPPVDFNLDEADEAARIQAIERRNRARVLIPLGLLIGLWAILSLFGDPLPADPAVKNTPTDKKAPTP